MSAGKLTKAMDEVAAKTPEAVIIEFRQGAGDKTDRNIADLLPRHYITKQMFFDNLGNGPYNLPGVTGSATELILGGTYIREILVVTESGSPSLNIGLTDNGGEILPTTAVGSFLPLNAQQYFANDANIYFNVSGGGSVNIYIFYYENIL